MHHWGLLRRALDASAQAGKMNPVEAVDIAHFAVALADALDPAVYGQPHLQDFRARSLTALGSAKRAAADFRGAEQAFRAAWDTLATGTGDPYEKANLVCYESVLLRDLGDFEAAFSLLDGARTVYEEGGDDRLLAGVLVQQANSIGFVDPLRAVELARRGLALLGADLGNGGVSGVAGRKDGYFELSARNALAYFLNEAGYPEEARQIQETTRPLYARFPGVAVQSRMRWLDGLIARNLGDYRSAEHTLGELRTVLAAHNFDLELVLVSLDLAEILLWSRRHGEAAQLIRETYPVLTAWGLEKDLLALWVSLESCLREQAEESTALMRDLAATLRRGWNRRRAAVSAGSAESAGS